MEVCGLRTLPNGNNLSTSGRSPLARDTRQRRVFLPSVMASVCRRWRQVAIRTTSLWCRLPMDCPELTHLALERSRPGPLQITIQRWENVPMDVVDQVVAESSRWSSLTCDLRRDQQILETM
ncbi:hypothetical protein AAF712_016920, partial [Marasmius tenuissimus]